MGKMCDLCTPCWGFYHPLYIHIGDGVITHGESRSKPGFEQERDFETLLMEIWVDFGGNLRGFGVWFGFLWDW